RPGPANVGVPVGAANPYAQHFRQAQRPASAGTGTTAGARVALVIVAAVSLLLTVAGAGAAFFVSSAGPRASPIPGVTGGSRSPSGPLAKASYFNDATPVPGQIKAKFGQRLMLKRLVVYDEYVIFSAQNPQKNGSIDGGRPETFTGDQRKLEAELFSIDEIPFGSLAGLSRDALTRLQAAGVSDGKVTHIIVERENFGRGPGVILRPYVSSERRGGGYVEYDLRGNVKRVVGP
ncbi:MAG: hypothetical protein MUF34_27155, partial [Polyangiaceae bacterium]|nr:hypothetical protein [Polyangiaceae bacterium]